MRLVRAWSLITAAALLTGVSGFATFPVPASAGTVSTHAAAAGQPLATAVAGGEALTLSNGTRVVVDAPWAAAGHAGMTGRARSFAVAGPDDFCIWGALENGFGPRAAAAPAGGTKYPLAIKGFNLAGAPDNGDQAVLFSATSMDWNKYHIGQPLIFRNGLVTLNVPAGKYWLIGLFSSRHNLRMDIPAQVTVTGSTTATVSARAASSEAAASTPRRAVLADAVFSSSYTMRGGQTFDDCGTSGRTRLWVSPLARTHTTGTLYSATSAQLNSPPGQGQPYTYELDAAAPSGTIASQHLTVTAANLATEHERFYSDTATTAPWLALGGPARQYDTTGYTATSTPVPVPGDRTVYFEAGPTTAWRPRLAGPLTEIPAWQRFRAGQTLSADWNAYPLHPAPNLAPAGVTPPTLVSAARAGRNLLLDLTPFSDNTPGHTGSGLTQLNGVTGRGHWAIYANGGKTASGKVITRVPFADVRAAATLSSKPSRIKFTLSTSRQGPGSDLSGASQDTWTWPSRAEPHAIVPAPWYCGSSFTHGRIVYDRHCASQDMMTLDYQLARESLDGTTPAGPQTLGIAINHLPTATPYPVAQARLQVSYNHGTSWQDAVLARICHRQVCTNHYRASYTAPAGALVSLRVTARDTHRATVTETILGAYQTA